MVAGTYGDNANADNPKGFVKKIGKDNNEIYSSNISGDAYNGVTSVTESVNGNIVFGGYFSSSSLSATNFREGSGTLINRIGNTEGFVISKELPITEQNLEIKNEKKKLKITTDVRKHEEEIDGEKKEVAGGTITGSYTSGIPEIVTYGSDSIEEIIITPDSKYMIKSVEINGKKIKNLGTDDDTTEEKIENEYTINEDGTITLGKLKNVKEDLNIVVEFSKIISRLEVNHYLWTEEDGLTTQKVAETEYRTGYAGEQYTTSPKSDLEEYLLITNYEYYSKLPNIQELYNQNDVDNIDDLLTKLGLDRDEYYIPQNAIGIYPDTNTEIVNYYYKEKNYTLIVHHYFSETNTKVMEDEITNNLKKGASYTTNPAPADKIDYEIYEVDLNRLPPNENGVINDIIEGNTEITYYYKFKNKSIDILKVAKEDHSIKLAGTNFILYKLTCTEEKHDTNDHDKIIDYNLENNPCWEKVRQYTTNENGEITLENLSVKDEYRLVETKASEGRNLIKGQWKIEFILENYDESEDNIFELNNKTVVKITSIGSTYKTQMIDGKILIENKKGVNFPLTGSSGKERFFIIGILIMLIVITKDTEKSYIYKKSN